MNEFAEICGKLRVSIQPGQIIRDLDANSDDAPVSGMDFDERFVDFDELEMPETSLDPADIDAEEPPRKLYRRKGSKFRFVVTVLDASDIPSNYVDVFCQFKFLNKVGQVLTLNNNNNNNNKKKEHKRNKEKWQETE